MAMMVHGGTWLYMMAHDDTWRYVMVHDGTWWYMSVLTICILYFEGVVIMNTHDYAVYFEQKYFQKIIYVCWSSILILQ